MVSGTKTNPKKGKAAPSVKEKIFHPNSRKAGQLERASLRKSKLASASSKRSIKQIEKADHVGFWFHALPPDAQALTLTEIHEIIRTSWLVRHDEGIRHEESMRRKGRPPSKREVELKALKHKEEEEYRSGLELPDLTHEATVELFRQWNGDIAYLHLLRFIRLSSTDPTNPTIIRHGLREQERLKKNEKLTNTVEVETESMEVDTATPAAFTPSTQTSLPAFSEPPMSRFSSTKMAMDS